MSKTILIPAPINLKKENAHLFDPFNNYTLEKMSVKFLKRVFITYSGLSMNKSGLIKECHHDYPHQLSGYQNEAAHYYYTTKENPDTLITLDDNILYLQIHHPWYNYFHWITESLFRLWTVRNKLREMTLILPDHYGHADFIMGSLEPFRIQKIFFIPEGKSVLVNNLCLPQIKPVCDSFNVFHLRQVRKFYTDYVLNEKRVIVPAAGRVYLSRELAGRRNIINEEEVLQVIKKYDFQVFYPEKWTFLEQVAYFSKIKFLIGTHGSGLTNILFMSRGSSLLELHKDKTNELNHPSPLFWYMSHGLDIKYYQQLCDTYGKEDYFTGDYLVDAEMLGINIRSMLGLSQQGAVVSI
jgi:capsular polysaccharide biosynthesis protein